VFKYHYKKKGKTSAGKATHKTRSSINVSLVVPTPHQARSRKHRVNDEVVSEKRKKCQKVSDVTSSDNDDDYEGLTESDGEQEDDKTDNTEEIEQARDGEEEAGPVATEAASAMVSSNCPATWPPKAASK
jgi:hypothetical protein